MKTVSSILFLSLFLTACSGKNGSDSFSQEQESISVPDFGNKGLGDDGERFNLYETYQGRDLVLVYPHDNSWGWWKLAGRDAEKLYQTLRILPTNGNSSDVFLSQETKNGQDLTCHRQVLRGSGRVEFICSVIINYFEGSVSEQSYTVKTDSQASRSVDDYIGRNLRLDKVTKLAHLKITDMDARALYDTLNLQVNALRVGEIEYDRKSSMVDCRKELLSETYACGVSFNALTGASELPRD